MSFAAAGLGKIRQAQQTTLGVRSFMLVTRAAAAAKTKHTSQGQEPEQSKEVADDVENLEEVHL